MNDPIADMITRIKNAGAIGKASVVVPYSKFKLAIAEVLAKEGFIKSVSKKGKKINKFIELELIYEDGNTPRIRGAERISKFSKRVYSKAKDIKPVRSGYGIAVISTPEGILTDKEVKEKNAGGEVLFKIW